MSSGEEALALALSDVERRVARRLSQILARHQCSIERWRALNLLSGEQRHRMSELAEHTQLPPASLTRLVDGMVADNLVHRTADPRDRRGVLVGITRRGQALREALSEAIATEQLFPDEALETLARLAEHAR